MGRYFGGSWQFRGVHWDVTSAFHVHFATAFVGTFTSAVHGNFAAPFVGTLLRRFMAISWRRSLGRYFGGSWQFRGSVRWQVTSTFHGNFAAAFVGTLVRRFMAISRQRSLGHYFDGSWQFRGGVCWQVTSVFHGNFAAAFIGTLVRRFMAISRRRSLEHQRSVEHYFCVHGNDTRLLWCGTERAVTFALHKTMSCIYLRPSSSRDSLLVSITCTMCA